MTKHRRALFLGWLCVLGAGCLWAQDPVAAVTTPSGEVVVLDRRAGIFKFAANQSRSQPVRGFGSFEAIDLVADGDSYYVTLVIRERNALFTRLKRFHASGRSTGDWPLQRIGGMLAGIVIDPQRQVAYSSDSQLGHIYHLDLRNSRATLDSFVRVRDAGILGPMVFDAKRRRILVADVEKGKILAVYVDTRRVATFVGDGKISEPLALALDPVNDRLYIADPSQQQIWVGSAAGATMTVQPFPSSQRLREPVGIAISRDGTKIWIADRGTRTLWQLTSAGAFVSRIGL